MERKNKKKIKNKKRKNKQPGYLIPFDPAIFLLSEKSWDRTGLDTPVVGGVFFFFLLTLCTCEKCTKISRPTTMRPRESIALVFIDFPTFSGGGKLEAQVVFFSLEIGYANGCALKKKKKR